MISSRGGRGAVDATLTARVSRLITDLLQRSSALEPRESIAVLVRANLTVPRLLALLVLQNGGTQTVSSLAGVLHASPPTASCIVSRLVLDGLVDRHPDQSDRRRRLVRLTPEGARLLDQLHRSRLDAFLDAVGRLPPPILSQLEMILGEIRDELSRSGAPQ